MTYVETIEPRLTALRAHDLTTPASALAGWCRDLAQETQARLESMADADIGWQPHPASNGVGVTVWHVARWLDVLGSRSFTGRPASADAWHEHGWCERTGYEPDGIGYLGLGTLTGYTVPEMQDVPALGRSDLGTYFGQSSNRLLDCIADLGPRIATPGRGGHSPYQHIAATLQGSFGHLGEIDALVALRGRLQAGGA